MSDNPQEQPVLDPAQVFLALVTFQGDYPQTAAALRLPERAIRDLSDTHGWEARLSEYGYSGRAVPASSCGAQRHAAVQRLLNRSVNLIQGIRCRELLDKLLTQLLSDPAILEEFTTVASKNGHRRDVRPLLDLVSAIQTAQKLTTDALQDTRDAAAEDKEALKGSEVSLSITGALDAASKLGIPSSDFARPVVAPPDEAASAK